MTSLSEAHARLLESHIQYIEATYHLSNPRLIAERRALLRGTGVLLAEPWLEAMPRYKKAQEFANLQISNELRTALDYFRRAGLGVYDPPYLHQAQALEAFFRDRHHLLVTTGTGSGKTEVFLYSILGHLLEEAARGRTVSARGCRAIILYPMNALVSDQLTRLRRFIGAEVASEFLRQKMGRTVQFGMYTGRTLYHGVFDVGKNQRRVAPVINGYLRLRGSRLYSELEARGRVPAKNLVAFESGQTWRRFRTAPEDVELFTRQEMLAPRQSQPSRSDDVNPHGGTPDILVTNYSMLEYTLLRPIEQPLWDDTRAWLAADDSNQLLIVLDEAHLYRGAQGAEISLLLSRLASHLGVSRTRLRFILTSASLGSAAGDASRARDFASELTTLPANSFFAIFGTPEEERTDTMLPSLAIGALSRVSSSPTHEEIEEVAAANGWPAPPTEAAAIGEYLGFQMETAGWLGQLRMHLAGRPAPLSAAAKSILGEDSERARRAILGLCSLAAVARRGNEPSLALRLHVFVRGLEGLYACLNPTCQQRLGDLPGPLGKLFTRPRPDCDVCGSRVFEVWSHRDCGAAYIRGFESKTQNPLGAKFLWSEATQLENVGTDALRPVMMLVDEPNVDPPGDLDCRWLGIRTGLLADERAQLGGEETIPVWPVEPLRTREFVDCRACGQTAGRGGPALAELAPFGNIMDLQTKGEAPFANIVRTVFEEQPGRWDLSEGLQLGLPNLGRKVLCFSDSRQKAARLARDLQQSMERDAIRGFLALAAKRSAEGAAAFTTLRHAIVYLLEVCKENGISLFDGASRRSFRRLMDTYSQWRKVYSPSELAQENWESVRSALPSAVYSAIIRALCDRHFSLTGTMIGTIQPTESAMDRIRRALAAANSSIDRELANELVLDLILRSLASAGLDAQIDPEARRGAGAWFRYFQDGAFGLGEAELFPLSLCENDPSLTREVLVAMNRAVRESFFVTPDPHGRYFLNTAAVRLVLSSGDDDWFRCSRCSRPTPAALANRCPWRSCQGPAVRVTPEDPALSARKSLFRSPVQRLLSGARQPYSIRAEEHTAQLAAYQEGELHDRTERYELLFQDVLIPDAHGEQEQAIDILSCTTTMEVGIDIGSLTAVALRTVPPRPDNYQQRAGRAGRRGSSLATIVTFADLANYEQFIFDNPEEILRPRAEMPVVHVDNAKIIERHLFASMLQKFFHRPVPGLNWFEMQRRNTQLFESLGTLDTFYGNPSHEFHFSTFENWVRDEVENLTSPSHQQLVDLLPARGRWRDATIRSEFVLSTARMLVARLNDLSAKARVHADGSPVELLEALIRANLRPAFGFPLDLCSFSVAGKLFDLNSEMRRHYEPTTDLKVALTEYAPGRVLTIDKVDFESYGLHVGFPVDPAFPARTIPWDNLPRLVQCISCFSVLSTDAQGARIQVCDACGSGKIAEFQWLRPEGFSPPVADRLISTAASGTQRETRASSAKLPTPDLQDLPASAESRHLNAQTEVCHTRDQRLVISNLGADNEGYLICKDCGAVDPAVQRGHMRPFPRPYHVIFPRSQQLCQSHDRASGIALAHEFRTDVLLLRIRANTDFRYEPRHPSLISAAASLAEAVGLAAQRALRLERGELGAGWRPLLRDHGGNLDRIIDIFLYDDTPGGAGFASSAYKELEGILSTTRQILSCICVQSCNRCVLTFDNKHKSAQLDRHAAVALLNYMERGHHVVDPDQEQSLLDRVASLVRIRFPTLALKRLKDHWQLNVDGIQLTIGVRPMLALNFDVTVDEVLSEFSLRTDPPGVAERLSSLFQAP